MLNTNYLYRWLIPSLIMSTIFIAAGHFLPGNQSSFASDVVLGVGGVMVGWFSGLLDVHNQKKLSDAMLVRARESFFTNTQQPYFRVFEMVIILLFVAFKLPILPILYFTQQFYVRACYERDEAAESLA